MNQLLKPTGEELALLAALRHQQMKPEELKNAVMEAPNAISLIIEAVRSAKKDLDLPGAEQENSGNADAEPDSLPLQLAALALSMRIEGVKRPFTDEQKFPDPDLEKPKFQVKMPVSALYRLYKAKKIDIFNIDEDSIFIGPEDRYATIVTSDNHEIEVLLAMPDRRLIIYVNDKVWQMAGEQHGVNNHLTT